MVDAPAICDGGGGPTASVVPQRRNSMAGGDLLQRRAEMAQRLRQSLMDPVLRSAVKERELTQPQRCNSVPSTPGRQQRASSPQPVAEPYHPPPRLKPRPRPASPTASSPTASQPAVRASASGARVPMTSGSQSRSHSVGASSGVGDEDRRRPRAEEPKTLREARRMLARTDATTAGGERRARSVAELDAAAAPDQRHSRSKSRKAGAVAAATLAASLASGSRPVLRGRRGESNPASVSAATPSLASSGPPSVAISPRQQRVHDVPPIESAGPSTVGSPRAEEMADRSSPTFASGSPKQASTFDLSGAVQSAQSVSTRATQQHQLQLQQQVQLQHQQVQLQQELQIARDRLVELEAERRWLIESSLAAMGGPGAAGGSTEVSFAAASPLASGAQTPASTCNSAFSVAWHPPTPATVCGGTGLDDKGSPSAASDSVEPEWLLADGRLLTSRLEGENRALRRAVARARGEIDELVRRRAAAESRAKSIAEENHVVAEALGRINVKQSAFADGTAPTKAGTNAGVVAKSGGGGADTASAALSLRRLLLLQSKRPSEAAIQLPTPAAHSSAQHLVSATVPSLAAAANAEEEQRQRSSLPKQHVRAQSPSVPAALGAVSANGTTVPIAMPSSEARDRLLSTSHDIGRRMEEILARRSKLQASEAETDAGSSALSGDSCSSSQQNVPQAPQ